MSEIPQFLSNQPFGLLLIQHLVTEEYEASSGRNVSILFDIWYCYFYPYIPITKATVLLFAMVTRQLLYKIEEKIRDLCFFLMLIGLVDHCRF